METGNEQVKYTFSSGELVEIAKQQGRYMQDIKRLEEEFDSIKAAQKNNVTRLETDISDCTRKIMSGYDMRLIKCLILKARPDNDSMLIVRTDNGRVWKQRKMNADERQIKLSTEPPELMEFEADFWDDDSDGVITTVNSENVPLTAKEANELKDIDGLRIRTLRKKLEAAS